MDFAAAMPTILRVHALSSVMLAGLIWTIQVVHYPLFARVGEPEWTRYAGAHQARITTVVGPLMIAELITAALLLLPATGGAGSGWMPIAGAALVAVIWASTCFVQVPLHARLERGFDPAVIERLVATNWVRTIAWTLRALIAIELLRRGV